MNENEYKQLMQTVSRRKEKQAKIEFKSTGSQETFSFYKNIPTSESTGTLYKKPDQKRFILERRKVKAENRGIFTNPTKFSVAHQNDYFQFYFAYDPTQERIKVLGQKDIQDKLDKVQIRKKIPDPRSPFSPSSLKKCEPFINNVETYGIYNDLEKEEKLKKYAEYKKRGNPRFHKSLPKGSVEHMKPFFTCEINLDWKKWII